VEDSDLISLEDIAPRRQSKRVRQLSKKKDTLNPLTSNKYEAQTEIVTNNAKMEKEQDHPFSDDEEMQAELEAEKQEIAKQQAPKPI